MIVSRFFGCSAFAAGIWKGQVLTGEDRQLWNDMESILPTWAFFKRREISSEDEEIQDQTSRAQLKGLNRGLPMLMK
jgi:hypothetical protein